MEYSIKEIETQTGIKAFTIRIWEKRYNLTTPKRTDSNIRIYSEDDLHKILAVSALVKRGFKISEVAPLSTSELNEKLKMLESSLDDNEPKVNALLMSADKFDEQLFEKAINREILSSGFENAMIEIVAPLVNIIEERWILSPIYKSVKQFAFDQIRRKIILASDNEPIRNSNEKFLVFSNKNDTCEMTSLFVAYLIKKHGFQSLYIGENIEINEAERVAEVSKCNHIILIDKIYNNQEDISEEISAFEKSFSNKRKYILANNLNIKSDKIKIFQTLKSIAQFLNTNLKS